MLITTATPEVMAAADEILAIRDRVLADRILTGDHPGAQQIIASPDYGHVKTAADLEPYFGDDDHLLENVVFQHFTELPNVPIERPAWADEVSLLTGDLELGELGFLFTTSFEAAGVTLRLESQASLIVEDSTDPDGNQYTRGTIYADEDLRVDLTYGTDGFSFDLADPADLRQIGDGVTALADRLTAKQQTPLRRNTEPGAPATEELAGVGL